MLRFLTVYKFSTTWESLPIQPDGTLGSTWIANSQYIYMGSHERLTVEKRQEMIKNESQYD